MIISLSEACKELGVHRNTVHKYLSRGQLIGRKTHRGEWQILASSVMRLKNERHGRLSPIDSIRQLFRSSELIMNSVRTPMLCEIPDRHGGHFCPRAHIVGANEAWLEMLGYTKKTYERLPCEQLYHPDETEIIHGIMPLLSKNGGAFCQEVRLKCSNGKYLWIAGRVEISRLGSVDVGTVTARMID